MIEDAIGASHPRRDQGSGHGSDSEWTGLRGRLMAWYLNSPLRRLSEALVLGDSRAFVLAEAAAALGSEGVVLDVGAGSGYFSLTIAARLRHGRVICLDLSREMLDHLRRAAERRGLAGRVELLEGSAYQVRVGDGSVDLTVTNGVLHELARPAEALQEMVRVVRPGGRVVVTDFRADTWIGRRVAAAHRREAHGPFTPEQLAELLLGAGLAGVSVSALPHLVVGAGSRATST